METFNSFAELAAANGTCAPHCAISTVTNNKLTEEDIQEWELRKPQIYEADMNFAHYVQDLVQKHRNRGAFVYEWADEWEEINDSLRKCWVHGLSLSGTNSKSPEQSRRGLEEAIKISDSIPEPEARFSEQEKAELRAAFDKRNETIKEVYNFMDYLYEKEDDPSLKEDLGIARASKNTYHVDKAIKMQKKQEEQERVEKMQKAAGQVG